MKAAWPTTIPLLTGRLGRALSAVGILALLLSAWLGWSSNAAQLALEGPWALCAAR